MSSVEGLHLQQSEILMHLFAPPASLSCWDWILLLQGQLGIYISLSNLPCWFQKQVEDIHSQTKHVRLDLKLSCIFERGCFNLLLQNFHNWCNMDRNKITVASLMPGWWLLILMIPNISLGLWNVPNTLNLNSHFYFPWCYAQDRSNDLCFKRMWMVVARKDCICDSVPPFSFFFFNYLYNTSLLPWMRHHF